MRQLVAIAIGVILAFAAPAGATPGGESVDDANVGTLRLLLEQPEGHIDLAKAKVTIDRMVDPAMDVDGTLQSLDEWTARVRSRFPPGASNKVKVDVLVSTLYEPGPWNDHRPFAYDFTDPYGGNLRNTLLPTMLASRTGQCVSMPIAFVLLGQKLRLPLTMTTAPYHLLAKYGDEETGQWMNLEATSGKFHYDSGYEHSLRIPPEAIRQQTFLRPYTQRESVALFATATLVPVAVVGAVIGAAIGVGAVLIYNEVAEDSAEPPAGNTNPYDGPVDAPVTVADGDGNAVPVAAGEQVSSSPGGNPTGTRLDKGGHQGHADPKAQAPHGHQPGISDESGNPHLPLNQPKPPEPKF